MNSRFFTAAWLVSAAVLSSWAVSSAADQARPAPAPRAEAAALPDLSMEIDAEIVRLSTRMPAAATPAVLTRDPFRFKARRAIAARKVSSPSANGLAGATAASEFSSPSLSSEGERSPREAVALPIVANQPTLSGVAEISAGALTAVINLGGELHYARKGDVIASRYRVDAITLDGVDVFDLVLGTISRLKLQA